MKDNLGGNSKTVMVATVSPSADNYEETLSTLRYADRAKRILTHAVVNEDPNARIIRELRAEIDALKEMLVSAGAGQQPGAALTEKLTENEALVAEMSLTWEQKLLQTEQKQGDRRQALEKMGISVQSSGIKVEKNKYFLVNLNDDPSLNELLVYYLKERTLVGRAGAATEQDIQLLGLGIQPEHCVLSIASAELFITPLAAARTCVNGVEITETVKLCNGDRILWGSNHFFRVNCPRVSNCDPTPTTPFDWRMAQEEVLMAGLEGAPMREAMAKLEQQIEAKWRGEYEKQFQQLQSFITPTATPPSAFTPAPRVTTPSTSATSGGAGSWEQARDPDTFKLGLATLREEILRANVLAREANLLAEETGGAARFRVTLQIPARNLAPGTRRRVLCEPAVLVTRPRAATTVWSVEELDLKLIDMRELYEEAKSKNISFDQIGQTLPDPFAETSENHHLIGVANIFLDVLFHDVSLDYQTPIISQHGEVAGRLLVSIERTSGSLHSEAGGEARVGVRVAIRAASGLPPSLAQFVFCRYRFWGEEEAVTVSPHTQPGPGHTAASFTFDHEREIVVAASEELLEHCAEGALSVEVRHLAMFAYVRDDKYNIWHLVASSA